MRATVDRKADMAYVYIESASAGPVTSIPVERDGVVRFVIDVDADGRLLGIEVFGIRNLGPDALATVVTE